MIKLLRLFCLLSLIVFVFLGIYGNNKFININYDIDQKDPTYSLYYYDDYTLVETALAKKIVDDKNVDSIEDIASESEHILKIDVKDKSVTGYGVINNCVVKEVYKGNKEIDNNILIYDYTDYLSETFVSYFEGSKPLDGDNEYIVFLKKAPAPNVENTYIFTSINFGSFPVNKTGQYITDYQSGSKNLSQTYKYDYIHGQATFVDMYIKLSAEVDELIKMSG